MATCLSPAKAPPCAGLWTLEWLETSVLGGKIKQSLNLHGALATPLVCHHLWNGDTASSVMERGQTVSVLKNKRSVYFVIIDTIIFD